MRKIIVTVGISGSGKSTFANNLVQVNPNLYTVINRDKLRELLFGYTEENVQDYYNRPDIRKLEKQVSKYEDILIKEALASGLVPIIDATHLKREYLERFKYWNTFVDVVFHDITLEKAINRDGKRRRSVGAEIITRQYNQYKSLVASLEKEPIDFKPVTIDNNEDNPPVIIFDIDGTLAHKGDRSPYDWKAVGKDTVDVPTKFIALNVAATNKMLGAEGKLIICTGRDGSCLNETVEWLNNNNISFDSIYIRDEGDMRPDWVIKEEMWREICKDHYIVGMFDDREQVVNRARALGLKVFQCEYHNF